MWKFINGSDEAFETLEERAREGCIRFADQQMPPGVDPQQAAVGFEVDPEAGIVHLFVDRNISYDGPVDAIRCWIETGEKSFESFAALRVWLDTTLRQAFEGSMVVLPEDLQNNLPS